MLYLHTICCCWFENQHKTRKCVKRKANAKKASSIAHPAYSFYVFFKTKHTPNWKHNVFYRQTHTHTSDCWLKKEHKQKHTKTNSKMHTHRNFQFPTLAQKVLIAFQTFQAHHHRQQQQQRQHQRNENNDSRNASHLLHQ